MDLLEKRVTSDWIEVREKLNTPTRMKAYLKIDDAKVAAMPDELRACTLSGIVEYKRKVAGSFFNFLTRLAFTTPDQSEILGAEADLRRLILVMCWETQFATGQQKPAKEVNPELAGSNARNRPPLEEVINEVKGRVAGNAELAKNPHVKNIFMEIQLYQKEFAQFAAMSPQISDDRAPTFFMNYKKRLDGILESIHGHFRDIRMAEDEELRKEFMRLEEDQFIVPDLVKQISAQAQLLTFVRSSIFHALQEGYQIRNLLLKLVDHKEPFFGFLDEELAILDTRQEADAGGHPAAVKLARSLAAALEGPRRS